MESLEKEILNKNSFISFYFWKNYENFIIKKGREIFDSKNINIIFNRNLKEIVLNNSKNKVEKIITIDNKGLEKSFFAKEIVLSDLL